MSQVYLEHQRAFEERLGAFVAASYSGDSRLQQACRYALLGQGKRVRPVLTTLACQACGVSAEEAQRVSFFAGLAVELIHTYSLVHDDLPSLDNDDLRRGRPTVHKEFDDATALLVGDALLSDAWAVLVGGVFDEADGAALAPGREEGWWQGLRRPAAHRQLRMVQILAEAVGSRGMVDGQMLDMAWTKRDDYTSEVVSQIHRLKTGRLIAAACSLGGLAGEGSPEAVANLGRFGENLGLAFQVIDDLLDDREGTGKSQGKDREQGKLTYLRTVGRAEAQELASVYTAAASSYLEGFGEAAEPLAEYARLLLERPK